MIGQTAGNYRIVKLLGEGGMGTVYLAVHPTIGRKAAVKVLREHLARDPEIVARFFNEARAANAIHHAGIVEIFDSGVLPGGDAYIVMEFLDGESLAARMLRGRMPLREAAEIARQAAGALGAAHAQGIVHRDLKPDNLFLVPDERHPGREQVKLLDFGIAKLGQGVLASESVRTRTGAVMGTPLYMSPEQCRGTREIDHRSDIYSLGVILYEMVCGQPPFFSEGFGELAHLHISAPPPPPHTLTPGLPPALEAALLRALSKEPAARFASMSEFARAITGSTPSALEEAVTAEAMPAPRISGSQPTTTLAGSATAFEKKISELRPRRRVGLVIGGTAALVAAGAIVVLRPALTHRSMPAAPALPTPVTPAAAPPRLIEVVIASDPTDAVVVRERDGAVLGRTPFKETWRQASGVEKLHLERDGYRFERLEVPLDRGLSVTVTLKKEQPAAAKKERTPPRHKKPASAPSKWEAPPKPAAPPKWDNPKEPVPI
jgi:tRNA A-37 threonylcarbamoyl transferase component Bud32